MTQTGYSGTPLIKKLGIKPGMKILLKNQPDDYQKLLGVDMIDQFCKNKEVPDLIHLFVRSNKEFQSEMKKIFNLVAKNNKLIIWVSWYKKSAKLETDITEDVIRDFALKNGLVDVKVCAVSDIWSGLKLVVPLKNRK
jgi:hypothetical protein